MNDLSFICAKQAKLSILLVKRCAVPSRAKRRSGEAAVQGHRDAGGGWQRSE